MADYRDDRGKRRIQQWRADGPPACDGGRGLGWRRRSRHDDVQLHGRYRAGDAVDSFLPRPTALVAAFTFAAGPDRARIRRLRPVLMDVDSRVMATSLSSTHAELLEEHPRRIRAGILLDGDLRGRDREPSPSGRTLAARVWSPAGHRFRGGIRVGVSLGGTTLGARGTCEVLDSRDEDGRCRRRWVGDVS